MSILRAPVLRPFFRLAVLLLAFPLAGPVSAQTASLVRDINSTTPWTGSLPAYDLPMVELPGKIFFASQEPAVAEDSGASSEILADLCPGDCPSLSRIVGRLGNLALFVTRIDQELQLYRTDGTRAGTYAVADLGPINIAKDSEVFLTRDHAFFVRRELGQSPALWVSDGTAAGTRTVPFPGGANPPTPFEVAAVGSQLYLVDRQNALWRTDGTAAGTVLLHAFTLDESPSQLAAGATRLYFKVLTGGGLRRALWTSDGTPGGTLPVAGFPVVDFIDFAPYRVLGDHLYAVVDDQVHGYELWTADGTASGSHRVSDLADPDPFGALTAYPPFVVELGGRVVFATLHGLYASDGTPGSTTLLAPDREVVLWPPVRVGSRALYLGQGPSHAAVWSTDGTAAGTVRLAPDADQLVAAGGAAWFAVTDSSGTALWTSDGTAKGTRRYSDPLPLRVQLGHLTTSGSQVFFFTITATTSQGPISALWTSDGQPGGTHPVAGASSGTGSGAGSSPHNLVASGGRLSFTACDGATRQVWTSDGTTAGTAPLTALPAAQTGCSTPAEQAIEIRRLTPVGNQIFFVVPNASTDLSLHLFRAAPAGAAGNAIELAQLSSPELAPLGGEVFFLGAQGQGLSRSDGTLSGTRRATELAAIPNPTDVAAGSGLLFVTANDGSELWASDGTAAGTRRLLSGPYSRRSVDIAFPGAFVQAGRWTYFFVFESGVGTELWRTDGTAGETARVAVNGSPAVPPVAVGSDLYLFTDPALGRRLYRIDAADPANVTLLQTFPAVPSSIFDGSPSPAAFAGKLYFAADDGTHGRGLWTTDGTPGGTVQVTASAAISQLTPAGGRLFFTAWDPAHGIELWQSDGTTAGTRLAADLAPESASSSPALLTAAGDRLYFTADDGVTGREFWSLPLSGPSGCRPTDTRLCLAGGRFQVEIAWKDFQGRTGAGHAVALTADTGYFWFFDPANVETVVKVLDARALNNAFWVFYGALSNVGYEMTVTDTQTGLSRRYLNPPGLLASVGDTAGFGPQGAYGVTVGTPAPAPPWTTAHTDAKAASGTCTPGPTQLCLQGGRFAVTSTWKDFQGRTGTGTAVPLSGDTGYFWFFAPTNVEVVAKVLDGTGLNGKFWFFYGALSNVEYTLTVTDTRTGAVKTYKNPSGQFGSLADTGAF